MNEFLTTREVADLLRLKERKVYELAKTNAIPVARVTGKLLFPRDLIVAWVRRRTEFEGGVDSLTQRPPVLAGSHDPLLDWALRESNSGIATFYDGSLDGLKRLAGGQAIAAGIHLHEGGGDGWNRDHLARAMPGEPVVLIEWAKRQQGLLLPPGNPHKIERIADLRGRRFIPRQATAGSHRLFYRLMEDAGLKESDIAILSAPARNETDVALAIADGIADAGLAVETAARQMRLDFVPLTVERFDIAVWRRDYFEEPLQRLFAFARTRALTDKARALGGYDLSGSGAIHFNGP